MITSPSLSALLVVSSLSLGTIGITAKQDDEKKKRQGLSPSLDLLPKGSILREVRIPSYDKNRRRAGLLRANLIEVISEHKLRAEEVELRVFSEKGDETRVNVKAGTYANNRKILHAQGMLSIHRPGVQAKGHGGFFRMEDTEGWQGYVMGPVTTAFQIPRDAKKEDDKPKPVFPPLAHVVSEFLEPQALTPAERREIDRLLVPITPDLDADRRSAAALRNRGLTLNQEVDQRLNEFLRGINRPNLLKKTARHGAPAPVDQDNLAENEIQVTCQGGMFLDPKKGYLSYRRNITLTESTFVLTCGHALKVILEGGMEIKTDRDALKKLKRENIKMIVASGGVRVVRHDPEGKQEPVVATAEIAMVDQKSGDILLHGGTPSVQQGENVLRAGEPNLYLRYYENGNVIAARGKWMTSANLDKLEEARKKPGDNPEIKKKPETISITCDGGIFFDAEAGRVVYLENVRVSDPRFKLQAQDELKIYLRRTEESGKKLKGPQEFSDVDYIVASGEVAMTREDPKGKRGAVKTSSEHVVFDLRTSDVFLMGGSPTLVQGENYLQANDPDLYLRFYENGSMFASAGNWTTRGDLANVRTKPGEPKEDPRFISATCKGGLSFDSIKGRIIYRDSIRVTEPRFVMNCRETMEVHLKKRENAEKERLEGPEAFSDVKGIVASGGVHVIRKDPRGKAKTVHASADTALYDAALGDIVLKDGFPQIKQGNSFMQAKEKGLYVRFYGDGRFYANKGAWETVFQEEDLRALQKQKEEYED